MCHAGINNSKRDQPDFESWSSSKYITESVCANRESWPSPSPIKIYKTHVGTEDPQNRNPTNA
jgi:hypothetical protein